MDGLGEGRRQPFAGVDELSLRSKERKKMVTRGVLVFCFLGFFCLFRASPTAYGASQAKGPIRAVAAGLRHSHSNLGSELHLQPTPQLTAMSDP